MNEIETSLKPKFRLFVVCLLSCIVAFSVLIANELTNTYDGMWQGSYYTGYSWVISIGRWFWPVVGKLRLNMSPEPFTTVISLMMFVAGSCIVVWWFGVKEGWKRYLIVLLSVINTAVCVDLSYRYMSPTFSAAYLLSVLGFYLLARKLSLINYSVSVLLLTLSLACYQACIGVFCLLVLLNTFWMIKNGVNAKYILLFITLAGGAFILSAVLYKILWEIILNANQMQVSNYRGASALSVSRIVTTMPKTIINAYIVFVDFFFKNEIRHNAFQECLLYRVILAILFVKLLTWGGQNVPYNLLKHFLCILCIFVIPVATNVALLLSADTGSVMVQQTLPMEVIIPFCACLTEQERHDHNSDNSAETMLASGRNDHFCRALCGYFSWTRTTIKPILLSTSNCYMKFLSIIVSVFLILIFFGDFLMVSVDQHVMLSSKENTIAFFNRVASDLEDYDSPENGYVFLGKVSDNSVYRKSDLWWKSNGYARYGDFYIGSNGNTQSYNGLLRDAGLNLSLNWNSDYWHELEKEEDIKSMPSYPKEGYIKEYDGVIVVKLSEY